MEGWDGESTENKSTIDLCQLSKSSDSFCGKNTECWRGILLFRLVADSMELDPRKTQVRSIPRMSCGGGSIEMKGGTERVSALKAKRR